MLGGARGTSHAFTCSSCHALDGLGGTLGPRLLRPDLADPQAFTRLIAGGRRGVLAHLRSFGRVAGG